MRIRKLRNWKHANTPRFRGLDALCFPEDIPFLNSANYHWWEMRESGCDPVAYAGLYIDGDEAHFSRAGVLKEHRGKGYQKKLIKARLAWCRRNGIVIVYTYTSAKNKISRRNLRACGFDSRKIKSEDIYRHKHIISRS